MLMADSWTHWRPYKVPSRYRSCDTVTCVAVPLPSTLVVEGVVDNLKSRLLVVLHGF